MDEAIDAPVATEIDDADDAVLRIYEAGYLILPTVPEDQVESVVADIRSFIEKAGGTFIAEGAPVSTKLAYTMYVNTAGKQNPYDRAWFGWIKFEVTGSAAHALTDMLLRHSSILRSIIFRTVREDTRASARHALLREVKRTDTIKSDPTKGAADAGVISDEAIDKSIEGLIA
jgi:ribosomal protein S6